MGAFSDVVYVHGDQPACAAWAQARDRAGLSAGVEDCTVVTTAPMPRREADEQIRDRIGPLATWNSWEALPICRERAVTGTRTASVVLAVDASVPYDQPGLAVLAAAALELGDDERVVGVTVERSALSAAPVTERNGKIRHVFAVRDSTGTTVDTFDSVDDATGRAVELATAAGSPFTIVPAVAEGTGHTTTVHVTRHLDCQVTVEQLGAVDRSTKGGWLFYGWTAR